MAMNIDVYISNISEDVWEFIESSKKAERTFEIEENAYLSDRELLALNPAKKSIIILPEKIDPAFLEYYKQLFGNNSVEVWVPRRHSGQVCLDVLQDKQLWQSLVAQAQNNSLVLKSYASSPQFYQLVTALKDSGCQVLLTESPQPEHQDVANYFGSKSGVRETVSNLAISKKRKLMAEGATAQSVAEAVSLATKFYTECGGVVLKTNKAHSGAGVVITPPGTVTGDVKLHFERVLSQEKYWTNFPIVVEEFLVVDASVGGGNPNCEFKIDEHGQLQLLFTCGMRITPEGVFKGVEISNHMFDETVQNALLEYGKLLGSEYLQAGYCGYFDVDCMFTQMKELLITESNVRKTGGTHVYHAGNLLLGSQFCDDYYLLSNNTHPLPEGKEYSFSELLSVLQPILFSRKTREGVILASSNILKQHKLSHVIVGADKSAAYALEQEMERLLSQ